MKKYLKILLLLIMLCPSFTRADETTNSTLSENDIIAHLDEMELDTSLLSGWNPNLDSNIASIFGILYDSNGQYLGYRNIKIFKDGLTQEKKDDYLRQGTEDCTIHASSSSKIEYEGGTYTSVDFRCVSGSPENAKAAAFDGSTITLGEKYIKKEGGLVGVKVLNKSFENVENATVKNDIIYNTESGGKATLVDTTDQNQVTENDSASGTTNTSDTSSNVQESDWKKVFIFTGIGVGILLIVVIIIIIIIKSRKTKKIKNNTNKQAYQKPTPANTQRQASSGANSGFQKSSQTYYNQIPQTNAQHNQVKNNAYSFTQIPQPTNNRNGVNNGVVNNGAYNNAVNKGEAASRGFNQTPQNPNHANNSTHSPSQYNHDFSNFGKVSHNENDVNQNEEGTKK